MTIIVIIIVIIIDIIIIVSIIIVIIIIIIVVISLCVSCFFVIFCSCMSKISGAEQIKCIIINVWKINVYGNIFFSSIYT